MNESADTEHEKKRRAAFSIIADILIPEFEEMPSASQIGISEEPLDLVLKIRPDLRKPWMRGIDFCAGNENSERIQRLHEEDPEAFEAVGLVAKAGYYMDPSVKKKIGYPGQERIEASDPYAIPCYVTNGKLQKVFGRGPIYKPTPGCETKSHWQLLSHMD